MLPGHNKFYIASLVFSVSFVIIYLGCFQVYRSHLRYLLLHCFPDHYGDVLKLILKRESLTIE